MEFGGLGGAGGPWGGKKMGEMDLGEDKGGIKKLKRCVRVSFLAMYGTVPPSRCQV